MKKSVLAWYLAASMAFSMTPTAAFAEDFTAGDTAEFLAEASEDAGDSAAETSEAEAVGDGIVEMNDGEEGIAEADETEDEQDGIAEAEDAEDTASADGEDADGFSDSEEEVVFADGETAAADLADADSTTTVGLNVASHTVEEIVAYMKAKGATLEDEVTYETEPVLTGTYSAGVLSDETKKSALAILNNVRYIAGLSEVTLDDEKAESQQAASLISALNGKISHYPTQPDGLSGDLYSEGYSACGKANLAAGKSTLNKTIVQGWMNDSDSSNIDCVGHRRWCLYPYMGKTAFGAVTGASTTYGSYYSMYVRDTSNLNTATETMVAWPAQTMPLEYFGDDYAWSLSVDETVTESDITVTLTRETESWTFSSSDSTGGDFYVNTEGCGQECCIIFRPSSITYADGDVFTVTVEGLAKTVSYTVTFFELDDYWHTHAYNTLSTYNLSDDGLSVEFVYACSCGGTVTETVATTITNSATCESAGMKKISFTDKFGSTHSESSSAAALGHDLSSASVSDYVISGTCSRCSATLSLGVVTSFTPYWNSDSSSSKYSAAVSKSVTAGDTIRYWLYNIASSSGLTDIDQQFVVESSDTDVISVSQTSDTMGTLTMKKGGTATITFYPKYNSTLTKTYIFTVACGDDNHTTELQNAKAATCTEKGYTGDTVCTACGETIETGTEIAALGHGTTELQNAKTATCTEDGYTGDTVCTVCETVIEKGETISAIGHTTTTINAKDATCTEDGYTGDTVCTVCETVVEKGETISATGHTTTTINAKDATCTAVGYSGDKYCTVCEQTVEKGEEIPMTAHTTTLQNATEATCTEDGYTGDTVCTVCETVIEKGETISATGHKTTIVNAKDATCTEAGYTGDEVCSVCQKTVTPGSVIAALGHTTEVQNAEDATCTEEGYTGDKYCTVCEKIVETGSVISAIGHKTESSESKAATCTEAGYAGKGVCTVCGETVTGTVIPAKGHTTELQNAKDATCTEAGYTGDEICTVCGATVTAGEEIAALGHTEKLVNAEDATCQKEGYTGDTYCSVCGEKLKSGGPISKADHATELQNAKAATCAAEGYTGDKICTVCGETIEAGRAIPKTEDHTIELKNVKAATCAAEGYTGDEICSVCGETIKAGSTIAKTEEHTTELKNAKAATCTEEGYTGDTVCTVCGKTVETGTTIEKVAHTTEVQNTKAATCAAEGYTGDEICSVCGETIKAGSTIAKTEAHTTVLKNAKAASCTAAGYSGDSICTVCGTMVEKGEILPAEDHTWGDEEVTKATLTQDGKISEKCTVCGAETDDYTVISHPAEISLDADSYTFNNKVKTPGVTVTDAEGYELSEGDDYTVEYATGRKNPGIYKVVITFRGDYSGTVERSFTILPKGTTIRRLKAGKKSVTVTLKKQKNQTTGYQVQYSTSKSFTSAKLATIKKNSTTKTVLKKLKSGKKYYVRVRTYTKVNGKIYYSEWSKAKTVKVK